MNQPRAGARRKRAGPVNSRLGSVISVLRHLGE
jgi:hypothetical protein